VLVLTAQVDAMLYLYVFVDRFIGQWIK
jgi:hypothetical protein